VRTVNAPAVEPPEVIKVHSHRVSCDGVGGALGHPRVYMEMGAEHFVECPYCDRKFVLAHDRGPGPHPRGCWVVDLILGKS